EDVERGPGVRVRGRAVLLAVVARRVHEITEVDRVDTRLQLGVHGAAEREREREHADDADRDLPQHVLTAGDRVPRGGAPAAAGGAAHGRARAARVVAEVATARRRVVAGVSGRRHRWTSLSNHRPRVATVTRARGEGIVESVRRRGSVPTGRWPTSGPVEPVEPVDTRISGSGTPGRGRA